MDQAANSFADGAVISNLDHLFASYASYNKHIGLLLEKLLKRDASVILPSPHPSTTCRIHTNKKASSLMIPNYKLTVLQSYRV